MNLTSLKKIFPKIKIADLLPFWDEAAAYAEINTPKREAMFFAQIGHECQGFTRFVENLNYSASALAATWPARYSLYPNAVKKVPNSLAKSIARSPEMIANITYANRMGNGPVETGDGWKFRGRGAIMITGRANYAALDDNFKMEGKIIENPDLLTRPEWILKSASYFWKSNKLNVPADKSDISKVREKINGGLIGLDTVKDFYDKILASP